jgi:hypothetical protein
MAVGDYSNTAGNNTAIAGINIGEGCSPANLNNAIRQMMADIKTFSDSVPSTATLMPKAAGTFSGTQPKYDGRGAYLHHNNAAFTSGRVFMQATGGSTPAGMIAGDILLEY